MATRNNSDNGSTDLESTHPSTAEAQHPSAPPSTPSVLPPSAPRAQEPEEQRSSKLFFDLSSEKAVRLCSDLINRTRDSPNLVTTTISEATHILVEHPSPLGVELVRARASLSIGKSPRFPRVLTPRWVEDSLRLKHWQPEETYLYPSPVENGEGELKGVVEEEAKEEGFVESSSFKASPTLSTHDQAGETPVESVEEVNAVVDHPSKALTTSKLWTSDEDDALALFLLSATSDDYTSKDENGLDIFDKFAATEDTRRPAAACRYHYKSWKWTIEDRMDKLSGGRPRAKAAKVKKIKKSSAAPKSVDIATDPLSKMTDETIAAQPPAPTSSRNADSIVSEDANFARFLASLNTLPAGEGVIPSTFELYSTSTQAALSHPSLARPDVRNLQFYSSSVAQAQFTSVVPQLPSSSANVCNLTARQVIGTLPAQARMSASSAGDQAAFHSDKSSTDDSGDEMGAIDTMAQPRTKFSNPLESSALSYVQATSNLPQPRETRPRSRRRDDDPSQQPSCGTQKKPRLESPWTNNSPHTPSFPVGFGIGSASNFRAPFLPPSTHPPPPSPSPSLSHSHDQYWSPLSHAAATPRTSSSHDASSPSSSSGTSSSNLPRGPAHQPSLLQLGTAPSSCVPPSPFCWFCSSYTSPSFSPFFLAAPSESNPRELVKIKEGRSTCEGCSEWLKTKIEGGGEFLLGVREMGKLERMSWVRERLEERGLRERLRLVNGKL